MRHAISKGANDQRAEGFINRGHMVHTKEETFCPYTTAFFMSSDDESEEALTIFPNGSLIKSYDDALNGTSLLQIF